MAKRVEIDDEDFAELLENVYEKSEVKSSNHPGSSADGNVEHSHCVMEDSEVVDIGSDWDENEYKVDNSNHYTVSDPSPNHLEVLRKHFGHTKFRPMQWDIIYNIINKKRDGCVVLATGYGKSLCYQFPPVFCNGTALVITPLISLMEDQTLALEAANIPACYLGAGQAGQGQKMDKLVQGDYRVVYLTPEFCTGDAAKSLFDKLIVSKLITLVAIDEAHCVSQWGHDFRVSYRKLGKIRDKFGYSTPILALTATATKQVQDDICSSLKLRNPFQFCSGFDRPNLYFAVKSKGTSIINDLRHHMNAQKGFGGSTIIYCATKKITENVANALEDYGVPCRYYHANLNPKVRKEVHHMFVRDEIQVIVATVAFGMGIDKPDVRLIIHYGAPKDMESYYQEVGRAGRDGLQSQCYCYYSNSDFMTNQYFLTNLSGQAYEHRKLGMLRMEQYLQSRQCRRKFLLTYFEPNKAKALEISPENCCDNCTVRHAQGDAKPEIEGLNEDGTYNFAEDAKLLLSAVNFFGGRFGITTIITFLCGGKNQKFRESELTNELFGKGKCKHKEWWRGLGRILLQESYLEEVSSRFNAPGRFLIHTVKVGRKGNNFISSKEASSLDLFPSGDMINILKNNQRKNKLPSSSNWIEPVILPLFPSLSQTLEDKAIDKTEKPKVSKDEEEKIANLYGELLKLRNNLAKQHSYMPYMVANNKTLLEVATIRPSNSSDLSLVEGFNSAKVEKYGSAILKLVEEFCSKHDLALKKIPLNEDSSPQQSKEDDDGNLSQQFLSLPSSAKLTYNLYQMQGQDINTIAAECKICPGTVYNHLSVAIKAGLPVDLNRIGLSESIQETVLQAIRSPPVCSDISRLRPIKDNCPRNITYEQIKLTLALLTRKYGIGGSLLKTSSVDLQDYQHVPPQKNSIAALSSLKTPSKISSASSGPQNATRNDLTQFVQKTFKCSHSPKSNHDSSSQKNDEISESHKINLNNDDADVWKDDDLFASIILPNESNIQQPSKKPRVDLSQFKQKNYKESCSSKMSETHLEYAHSENEKEVIKSKLGETDYNHKSMDVCKERRGVHDAIPYSDTSKRDPDKNRNLHSTAKSETWKEDHDSSGFKRSHYDSTNSKLNTKDYQYEIKKRMKSSSLFRK